MSWYCTAAKDHPVHGPYHDTEHGFPQREDHVLMERLAMEISQAGLSWLTVLKKRAAFFEAFDGFDIDKVAVYGEDKVSALLTNAGIIRNRRKIEAIIHNAGVVQRLRTEHGSFAAWLDFHHPLTLEQWVRLFRQTFRFTGPEICNEFLMGLGYLPGAHSEECPIYTKIARLKPPFLDSCNNA